MEPLVSVIIPAYNTEEYIGEMLDCVTSQTYRNIQIIVIDDGSTDNTCDIVRKKQIYDTRIELVEANHGGVSKARNIGINKAVGEKIFFWDSDDIVEFDTIERVMSFCKTESVNAVLYGYSSYINGVKGEPVNHSLRVKYENEEIMKNLCPHFLGHSFQDINDWIKGNIDLRERKEITALWRIMLDTSTIRANNLKFDENLSLGEDTKYINLYFLHETSIGFYDECFYYLRKRMDGLNMTSLNNPVLMAKNKTKLIEARKLIDTIAKENGYDTRSYWEGTMVFSAVELALRLSEHSEEMNLKTFLAYMENDDVKEAIKNFKPAFGIKALPFILLKHTNARCFYNFCRLIPKRVVKAVAR